MPTKFRWPQPPEGLPATNYLKELIRSLDRYDSELLAPQNSIIFNASRIRPSVEVSTNYAMGVNDSVVLADAFVAYLVVTLPTALESKNTFFDIKKIDTDGTHKVCVVGSGAELPVALKGSFRPSITLYSDGTNFWVI